MHSTRPRAIVAWSGFALTTALAVGCLVLARLHLGAAAPPGFESPGADLQVILQAAVVTVLGLLGAVVATRAPRNPIGWLLGLIGLALGVLFFTDFLYWHVVLSTGSAAGGVATYAAWLSTWMWIPAVVSALTVFPQLFPTGRPISRRWRALVWASVVGGTVTFAGTAFVPGPLEAFPGVVNPLGIDSAAVKVVGEVGFAMLVPTTLAAVASLVIRFYRSRGVERQQLKWVAVGSVVPLVGFALPGHDGEQGFVILLVGLLAVGGAVAIAMLRYRLYDIDVVINRTLVYGALSATLAAAYLGSVLVLQFALSPLTQRSDLAVAGSTLAVAALFRPARARIQGLVDRRFYRSRYDAARTVAAFSAALRDQVDLAELGRDLRAVVGSTMQPAHVSLWLRER